MPSALNRSTLDTRQLSRGYDAAAVEPLGTGANVQPMQRSKNRLVSGIASSWAGLALSIALAFFMSPYIVNKLGSIYYGIWALALQFTGYLNLTDFGIREAVVRYGAQYAARKQDRALGFLLSTAVLTYVPIALVCVLMTLACVAISPRVFKVEQQYYDTLKLTVLFTGLTIAQGFVFSPFSGLLYGLRRFDIANAIGMSFTVVRAALILIFLYAGFGVVSLAVIYFCVAICAGIATVIISLWLLKHRGLDVRFRIPSRRRFLATARRVVGYSTYAVLHSLGQKIVFSSDAIVAGAILSVQAVTPLGIAGGLVQYLRAILISAAKVFMPAASELQSLGKSDQLAKLFLLASKFTVLTALPVSMVFVVLGTEFVGLWMGPSFAVDAGMVLAVLGLTQVLAAPNYVMASVLYGISRHRVLAWLRLGEAVVNVSLSIALGKALGLLGVVLGTAIPHAILVLLILPRYACPVIGVDVRQFFRDTFVRAIIAAVPAACLLVLVRNSVDFSGLLEFFAVVAGIFVLYAASVFAVGLTADERTMVLRVAGLAKPQQVAR